MHKANVLRVCDGFFLDCVRAVAARYPQVQSEERIIDAMAALLVRDASRFDVIVTTNMFDDILTEESPEISGPTRWRRPSTVGARPPRQRHRQSGLADRLGRHPCSAGSASSAWWRRPIESRPRSTPVIANPEWRTPISFGTKAFGERVAAAIKG